MTESEKSQILFKTLPDRVDKQNGIGSIASKIWRALSVSQKNGSRPPRKPLIRHASPMAHVLHFRLP